MSNMRPQVQQQMVPRGNTSALDQAQQGALGQIGSQYQQELTRNTQLAKAVSDPATRARIMGVPYQQHAQNPHVQNALQAIGQFLGTIGHPLAGYFGSRMNPVAGAAVGGLNTVGQAGGAAGGALAGGIGAALNGAGGAGSAIGRGLNGLLTQTGNAGAAVGQAAQNLYRQ